MKVFELTEYDLGELNQDLAVRFFRMLLWAEASRVGISRYLIDVPSCINVGDGGLDAAIQDSYPLSQDVIPAGPVGFQIKSSDLGPSGCRKEIHKEEMMENPLKEEVKRLLDRNGTYVLVLFADIPVQMREKRITALEEEMKELGYENPKVRVYTINQILSFVNRFPAIVCTFKPHLFEGLPYESWGNNIDISSPKKFIMDERRMEITYTIKDELRKPGDQTSVFRILGLPGQGKTRLVFEILSEHDLRGKVIYLKADSFRRSSLCNVLATDSSLEAIIVVDECSAVDDEDFVRLFAGRGRRLSLITVSNEKGDRSPLPTQQFILDRLSDDIIREILSAEIPGLPPSITDRVVHFSGGSPRIAIILAQNYVSNPGASMDEILQLNDIQLMDRLIQGTSNIDSVHLAKTKKVLQSISLFEKVGYKGQPSEEAIWLSSFTGMDWPDFCLVVNQQKRRGIIQGDYYIYVTPFILAMHLAREWWEINGNTFSMDEFLSRMPQAYKLSMFDRFSSHLSYSASTEPGKNLLWTMLSADGPFSDPSFLDSVAGSRFFFKLAKSDPESALNYLELSIGKWSKEQLRQFRSDRLSVVEALEETAAFKEYFLSAAKLLLLLAETENQDYSNNATGVFVNLFLPAPNIGPTETPPIQRLPVLVQAINSQNSEQQKIALKALKVALQTRSFYFIRGVEHSGIRATPKYWSPTNIKESIEYYETAWKTVENLLVREEEEIRLSTVDILLESARGLVAFHELLSRMVLESFDRMSRYAWVDKGRLIETVVRILHYERKRLTMESIEDWSKIRDDLTGTDFSSLLRRFVKSDFLEDYFHTEEKHSYDWVNSNLDKLVGQVLERPQLLKPEYDWLATKEAKRGFMFGYRLGRQDEELALITILLEEHRSIASNELSVYFLGGYFRAIFEKDSQLWENNIAELYHDPILKKFLPILIWHSGMNDNAAKLILLLLKNHDIDVTSLSVFRYGGVINLISEPILAEWVTYLSTISSDTAVEIALSFVYTYYVYRKGNKQLPKESTLNLLLHPLYWNNPNNTQRGPITTYEWTELANELVNQFPETGIPLMDRLLEYYADKRSITSILQEGTEKLLLQTINNDLKKWTRKIFQLLGPPIDERALRLKEWLRGSGYIVGKSGPLLLNLNQEIMWEWVDEDKETRSKYFATFVPPLFSLNEGNSLARDFLVRYGKDKKVRDVFSANYSTELIMGSATSHYINKKKFLLELKRNEIDNNVINWITEYIERLDGFIEMSRIHEEEDALL